MTELFKMPIAAQKTKEKIEPAVETEPILKMKKNDDVILSQEKIELLKNNVADIISKTEQLNPEKINPYWIFNNCGKEHAVIQKNFRTLNNEINWQLLVDLLPEKQKAKWNYEKQRIWTEETTIKTTIELLEEDNPDSFNPFWIKNHDYGLYRHLRKKLKNKETGIVEWDKFADKLPEEWTEKWIMGISKKGKKGAHEKKMKFTFSSSIKKLNKILAENDPRSFSSTDVKTLDRSLHSYFKRYVKKENGGIDWKKIIKEVNPEFENKFKYPKAFKDEYPEERYEGKEEVDSLLEKNKEKLLTFFGATSLEDQEKRNEICLELIKLAKKGNSLAEKKLMAYLEILEVDWLDKEDFLDIYKLRTDVLREKTKRCIYLYREKGAAKFIWYLYKTLKEHAKELNSKHKKIELDEPFYKNTSKGNKYDRMNFEELPN